MTLVVQGGLVRRIIGWTGERRGLVIGLIISAAAFAAYGSASHGWMIYLFVSLGVFGGIAGPAAQALITKHVSADEQGAVQGALSGLVSLSAIFAPLLAAWSFGKYIAGSPHGTFQGIALYEASALVLVALALAFRSFHLDDRVAAAA
jgi:MFS transporter, DHA1 family, tetracycline resistance protein